MGIAKNRAERIGSTVVQIGSTKLEPNSDNDIEVKDTSNNRKKVIASELRVGTGNDIVIIKRDASTGKAKFETSSDGGGSTTDQTLGGTTVYANPGLLPAGSSGDMAFITSNNNLMVHNGSGWYKVATVTNASPTISSAGNASYTFATDGTPVSIEITASDPEGIALQYKWQITSGSLGSTATVTSSATSGGTYSAIAENTLTNNKYFKITPSTNSDHAGSFAITFSASDGINTANSSASSFTLGFDVGASVYFDGSGDYITSTDNSSFSFGTGAFSIECFYIPDFDTNGSSTIFLYDIGSENIRVTFKNGDIRAQIDSETQLTYSVGSLDRTTWYHIAFTRDGSGKVQLFHNGVEVGSYTSSTANITATTIRIADKHSGSKEFTGYISNFRIVKGQVAYTLNPETGASTSFDGSGDYIDTTNPLSGTGDFTMEGWIYHTTSGSYDGYFSTCLDTGANGGIVVAIDKFFVTHGGGSSQIGFSGGAIGSNGVWYHVALQRISNVFYLYKNGVQQGSASATVNLTGSTIRLGSRYNNNTTHLLTGYISNFRIVTGSAVYAASGFTPPTSPLTAISGTQLLTCQNSTGSITDASSNGYTITANGNAAGSAETPFATNFTLPTTDLSAVGGTNTKFLALKESAPKYENGGCFYVNSRYQGIQVDDAALEVGTGDFTIEFFYKFQTWSSATSYYLLFAYKDIQFGISAGSGSAPTSLGLYRSGWAHGTTDVGLNLGQWYHCAVVRTGGNIKAYIDGVQLLTTTNGASDDITDGKLAINGQHAASGYGINGGIWYSEIRFCSKAVYTDTFTPPRGRLTQTGGDYTSLTNVSVPTAAQTELLLAQRGKDYYTSSITDNSQNGISVSVQSSINQAQYGVNQPNLIDNSSAANTLVPSGSPRGSYASPFAQGAGGSIVCDDYDNRYIYVADSDIVLGSNDFCIEYWFMDKGVYGDGTTDNEVYSYNGYWAFGSSSGTGAIPFHVSSHSGGNASTGLTAFGMTHNKGSTNSAGGTFSVQSTNSSGNASFTTVNKVIIDPLRWYHMAIIRESGEIKVYFDGVYYPFASAHSVNTTYTFDRLAVGVSYAQYAALTGHISNFRLVVGSGVYTPSSGGGGSTIFDGSGDNLLVPSSGSTSTDLVIGTNDFTLEFWVNADAFTNGGVIYDTRENDAAGLMVNFNTSGNLRVYANSGYRITADGISTGGWHHCAIVRSGGVTRLFLNGVKDDEVYVDTNNYTGNTAFIGKHNSNTGADFDGYISNLRLVVGTAVYTSNFNVTNTPLTAITNTKLLTCQNSSGAPTDASSVNHTVDTSGSATGSSVAPFRDYITVPTSSVTAITNTKLLTAQHSNQIIDASGNCTIIPVNNCVATRINPF